MMRFIYLKIDDVEKEFVAYLEECGFDVKELAKVTADFLNNKDIFTAAANGGDSFLVYLKRENMVEFLKILRKGRE